MLVDAVRYVDGRRTFAGGVAELAADADGADGFVWIGLHDPAPELVEEVVARFTLHPLAIEDAVNASQRPKTERFGDWLLVVLRTARYLDEPEVVDFGEIQVFCSAGAVIVIRRGEPVPLTGVRRRLEAEPELLALGPAQVLHAIIDEVVDAYQLCLNGLDDDVSEVELDVFAPGGPVDPNRLIERIYFLQRELLGLHRALHPLLAAMPTLRTDPLVAADPAWHAYYRDVDDHLLRQTDQLGSLRVLIANTLTANATQIGLRQNEDMRRISAWVAIAAVPTMIAGIYGMNFEHMPELSWVGGYPAALSLMAGCALFLHRSFRRSGWL